MSGRYATNTTVSPEQSRAEIERTLVRYGATGFQYGWDEERGAAMVGFRMVGRMVRFVLPLPSRNSPAFTHTPSGKLRTSQTAIDAEYTKAVRQRWRALALVVKAKLEAVEAGISVFDEEFLAHIVLPDGRTYGEFAVPQIVEVYETKQMPPMLPGLSPSLALGDGRR